MDLYHMNISGCRNIRFFCLVGNGLFNYDLVLQESDSDIPSTADGRAAGFRRLHITRSSSNVTYKKATHPQFTYTVKQWSVISALQKT